MLDHVGIFLLEVYSSQFNISSWSFLYVIFFSFKLMFNYFFFIYTGRRVEWICIGPWSQTTGCLILPSIKSTKLAILVWLKEWLLRFLSVVNVLKTLPNKKASQCLHIQLFGQVPSMKKIIHACILGHLNQCVICLYLY